MSRARSLRRRFVANLRSLGLGEARAHLLVALSGGRDSVVLLDLLRAAARDLPLTLTAAHLDHSMRPGSEADAAWVRGLCCAWGIPLVTERLVTPPRSETEARRARYAFLHASAGSVGADWIVTAHHADDQAETVLFRVLRGSGISGLRAIPERTRSGLLRPLLPFWRVELAAHAHRHGLRWRRDPTNLLLGPARNRIRHSLLPEAERWVAPGARQRLVALAREACEVEAAFDRIVLPLVAELVRDDDGAALLARDRLGDYDPAVASRLLRHVLRRFGVVPDRAGTRTALQFITDARSGGELRIAGGVRVLIEYGIARIERVVPDAPDRTLEIPAVPDHTYEAALRLGGRDIRIVVGMREGGADTAASPPGWTARLDPDSLDFPLRVRGWIAGDRMRTGGGTKSLKKLFTEDRVPRSLRGRLPVLVDARGRVLWVAGIRRPPAAPARPGASALTLSILND